MHGERLCNLCWHKILLHAGESKVKKMWTIEERMREPYDLNIKLKVSTRPTLLCLWLCQWGCWETRRLK
jgi:hypothetical protein